MAKKNETMKTFNKAEIAGRVKHIDLEKSKNDAKENVIMGSVNIQYGDEDDQQVTVKVYKKELTSKGSVAKAYERLSDLIKGGITIAKAKELTAESGEVVSPTVLRIYGSGDFTPEIRLNEFHPEGGEYSAKPEVTMGFGNIAIDSVESDRFKAEFHNVIFLHKSPKREKNSDRLIVSGLYIDYNNQVKPLDFIVEDEEMADEMENLEKGTTIEIWGDIKIARIVKTTTTKSSFGGKGKTEEEVSYVSELLITGGDLIEDDDDRWVDPTFIKKALVERETFLKELEEESTKSSKPKGSGFKSKGKGSSAFQKIAGDDDIPF